MKLTRRQWLGQLTMTGIGLAANVTHADAIPEVPIRAVAFDAFPIFDPRPAFAAVKAQFPEAGDDVASVWFSKVFGYSWLRTTAGNYRDFTQVMREALSHTALSLKLDMSPEKADHIINAFAQLPVWPDVKPALERLRESGIGLAFLSNMTEAMLRANLAHNGLNNAFDHVLSTDRAQVFKPAPSAYQLGVEAFGLRKEEIAFAAFAAWDATGAGWFGYPTAWVNRAGQPPETLGVTADTAGSDLSVLFDLIRRSGVDI